TCRQFYNLFTVSVLDVSSKFIQWVSNQTIGIGNVEKSAQNQHTIGLREITQEDFLRLRHTITVFVSQAQDIIGAFIPKKVSGIYFGIIFTGTLGTSLSNKNIAIRCDIDIARTVQTIRELNDTISFWCLRLCSFRPAQHLSIF